VGSSAIRLCLCLLACACASAKAPLVRGGSPDGKVGEPPRASPLPVTSASALAPGATTLPEPAEAPDDVRWSRRWQACPPGQQLDEAQSRALDYLNPSGFGVVRVGPADTLSLRRQGTPSAEVLAKLDFQQTGLSWTGSACNVGGALWLEIELGKQRGWVNSFYARPTSDPRDETELVRSWLPGAQSKAKGLAQLAEQLRRAAGAQQAGAQASDGHACRAELVGSLVDGALARFVIYVQCYANDSIEASQLLVTAAQDAAGWSLTSVVWRDVCLRGAAEYCI
jgi:hypothetical protein